MVFLPTELAADGDAALPGFEPEPRHWRFSSNPLTRIALISAHGSPLARLGARETGGMNVYVGEVATALGAHGIRVDVFTRRKDPATPEIEGLGLNVRVIQIDAGPPAEMDKNDVFWRLPEFVANVRRFAEREGAEYDLIYSHYWLSGWAGTLLQTEWDAPHVTMFHTTGLIKNLARVGEQESAIRIKTERDIVAKVDRIIAGSPYDRAQLIRHYGARDSRVSVIPCGVDLALFRPMDRIAAKRALGLQDQRTVLFVGRPDPVKGLEILLRAFSELEEADDARLVIVGGDTGAALESYRRLAGEIGILERTHFEGAQPRPRMPLYYNAADVCVAPSYVETFGLVAAEALACGTPVIASRVGGLASTVKDGQTGYLIPWRCPGPFAERLEVLLGAEDLRAQFSSAARASVERYAWPRVVNELIAEFETVVQEAAERDRPIAVGEPAGRTRFDGPACLAYGA